jgi:hypothetical protein
MTPQEFGELVQLSTLLANESLSFFGGLQPSTSQRDRRAFVRTFFASVEALIWTLRRLALSRHYAGQFSFPPRELGLLRDEAYQLAPNGAPVHKPLRSGFEGTVLFVLRSCAAAYGVSFADPAKDSAWLAFRAMVDLRNRLTHPKQLSDVDIADTELDQLRATHQWFWTVTIGLMNTIAAAHNQEWL